MTVGAKLQRYVLIFVVCGLLGWVYEYLLITTFYRGQFVNGGPFALPILLIYAVGGLLIVALFERFTDRPVMLGKLNVMPLLLAGAVLILVVVVEFVGHWISVEMFGFRPWDYTGKFLNIQGRVALVDTTRFVILGMLTLYLIAPALDRLIERMGDRITLILSAGLALLLLVDLSRYLISLATGPAISGT